MSTGNRINTAKDDAAGVAISASLKAQIRGLNQAERNIEDGKSLINTMDGGMACITENLQRQRELTLQAMNDGVLTERDKEKIQIEIDQLTKNIDSIAKDVQFNGIHLLNVTSEPTAPEYEGDFTSFTRKDPFYLNNGRLMLSLLSTDGEEIDLFKTSYLSFHIDKKDGTAVDVFGLGSFVFQPTQKVSDNEYVSISTLNDLGLNLTVK